MKRHTEMSLVCRSHPVVLPNYLPPGAWRPLPESHRVAGAGEVEIARFDRRHHDRPTRAAALARVHALGSAEHLEIVQHEDRRLVPAKIFHRPRDLAFLDQERAVAREAGEE